MKLYELVNWRLVSLIPPKKFDGSKTLDFFGHSLYLLIFKIYPGMIY